MENTYGYIRTSRQRIAGEAGSDPEAQALQLRSAGVALGDIYRDVGVSGSIGTNSRAGWHALNGRLAADGTLGFRLLVGYKELYNKILRLQWESSNSHTLKVNGTRASASRYFGPGLGILKTPFARRRRQERSAGQEQPVVPERGVLESAYWGSVARPAAGLRGLEEHPSSLLSLAGPRGMGATPGYGHQ